MNDNAVIIQWIINIINMNDDDNDDDDDDDTNGCNTTRNGNGSQRCAILEGTYT